MTLWSCKVKKEDKVGAGPQKMAVTVSLLSAIVLLLLLLASQRQKSTLCAGSERCVRSCAV